MGSFTLGSVTQKLRWIPAGKFMMGSPDSEEGRFENEGPQHEVTISKGFWLFDTPCTQALWQEVMRQNPSQFKGKQDHPVENVSWYDCQQFFKRLSEKLPGLKLDLPREAEWNTLVELADRSTLWNGGWFKIGRYRLV